MSRLSPVQKQLLAEIREAGVLYVNAYRRYGRTVRVLEREGFVKCVEPDYSLLRMDGWSSVERLETP